MIPSGTRSLPVHEFQPHQFPEKSASVLLDPAPLLIVNFSQLIHYLIERVGAIAHLPDRGAGLIHRDGRASVFLKKQNSLVRERIGVNFRATEKHIGT